MLPHIFVCTYAYVSSHHMHAPPHTHIFFMNSLICAFVLWKNVVCVCKSVWCCCCNTHIDAHAQCARTNTSFPKSQTQNIISISVFICYCVCVWVFFFFSFLFVVGAWAFDERARTLATTLTMHNYST